MSHRPLLTAVLTALLTAPLALVSADAEAGFKASSFRKESRLGDNYWNAGSALDSNNETAWMVDPEQKNAGQWIELDTPSGEVDKVGLVVGFAKDDNTFGDYARVKKVRVEAWSVEGSKVTQVLETEASFEDKQEMQIIDIDNARMGGEFGGGRVRITVLEVYDGKDYPNLAVSEVRVFLKEFPAETMQITTYPDDAEDGHGPNFLEDLKDTTWWASAGSCEAKFEMKASGYGLSTVGIKSHKAPYARPKTVKLTANDFDITHTMKDNQDWQWLLLPTVAGYTGSAWGTITVEIVDCYEGEKGVAISEVKMNAASIEDI